MLRSLGWILLLSSLFQKRALTHTQSTQLALGHPATKWPSCDSHLSRLVQTPRFEVKLVRSPRPGVHSTRTQYRQVMNIFRGWGFSFQIPAPQGFHSQCWPPLSELYLSHLSGSKRKTNGQSLGLPPRPADPLQWAPKPPPLRLVNLTPTRSHWKFWFVSRDWMRSPKGIQSVG